MKGGTLVFERYFADTDVITVRGKILDYKTIVLVAILTGLANLILFTLFCYPNFFIVVLKLMGKKMQKAGSRMAKTSAAASRSMSKKVKEIAADSTAKASTVAAQSMGKRRTYKLAEANRRSEEQVKMQTYLLFHFLRGRDSFINLERN